MDVTWTQGIGAGLIVLAFGFLTEWVRRLKTNHMHDLSEQITTSREELAASIATAKTDLAASILTAKTDLAASIAAVKADMTSAIDKMEKRFNEALVRQDSIAREQTGKIHERLDGHINELHVKAGS